MLLLDLVRLLILVASIFSLNLSFKVASLLELIDDFTEGATELFLGVDWVFISVKCPGRPAVPGGSARA